MSRTPLHTTRKEATSGGYSGFSRGKWGCHWDVSPRIDTPHVATDPTIPSLSVPALHELRRIYCKHLLEVFATPETQELYDRGCITGTFTSAPSGERAQSFVVEGVTPVGIAALEARERT